MQRELNIRDENIESLTELLQESEKKVASLEEIIEQVKEENSSERHKILITLTNEREEITVRNDHLKVLKSLREDNEKQLNEIDTLHQENHLFNQDNSVLLKKVQEYEDSYNQLLNEKISIENDLIEKIELCTLNRGIK